VSWKYTLKASYIRVCKFRAQAVASTDQTEPLLLFLQKQVSGETIYLDLVPPFGIISCNIRVKRVNYTRKCCTRIGIVQAGSKYHVPIG